MAAIISWIEQHQVFFNLIFIFALAAATFLLWRATENLWDVTRKLWITRFLSRLPEWFLQWVVLPVACLTFFGGVWLAAHRFPGEYDWRYMVVSRLLRPHENPHGYWIIALGTSLSGLIQIPLPGFFYERLHSISPWEARLGWVFMVLGLAAMILMGITRGIFPPAHGVLGWTAVIGLVLSVMVNTGLVVKQGLSRAAPKDSTMCWSWISLIVLALIPMVGTSLSQLYRYFFARGHRAALPFVFSLAFWEWFTCVFLIVYLMLLLGLTCRLKRKTLNNPHFPFRPKSDQVNK
jgi:hypothetical protein